MVDFFHQQLSNRPAGPSNRATYSEFVRWLSIGALFLSLILAYAWSHREILNIHYQMEQIRRENQQLRESNTALRAEYSSLVNPERIDKVAQQLGLVNSNRAEVRILDSSIPVTGNLVAQSKLDKKTLNE